MEIYDLNPYPKSDRNGTYGGNAGSKEGILIDGEYWIVKYPKNTRSMERVALSYATTPLSEYLGSHIYGILGYDVHETRLGIRNNKLVVACRDFCGKNETLMELRTIKNAYSEELEKALDQAAISDSDRHMVDLVELVLQLNHNSVLSDVEGVKNRFWECSVVDVLINNNDRNNGNWGLVKTEDSYRLAPVFDNGASFFNKIDVVKMERLMSAPNFEKMISDSIQTIYGVNGKIMSAKNFLQYDEAGLKEAITRVVPKITEHLSEIKSFIDAIPEEYEGVSVMPKTQKKYYQKSLQANYDYLLKPAYERVLEVVKEADIELHFPKCFLTQTDDKFEEGKLFNTITLPKGTTFNGEDVSGCTIHPKEIKELKENPDEIIALFHKEGFDTLLINLNKDGVPHSKINPEDLKEALNIKREKEKELQKEKSNEKESCKEKSVKKAVDSGEEI